MERQLQDLSDAVPTVYSLSIHAQYRCRHSGVCCSSDWDVPVDVDGVVREHFTVDPRAIADHVMADSQPLNPDLCFETFIIGHHNRLAVAFATAIATVTETAVNEAPHTMSTTVTTFDQPRIVAALVRSYVP